MAKTTDEILRDAATTYQQRHPIYGKNWTKIGAIFKILFPHGLELKTEADFIRFYYLAIKVAKLSRYCNNFTAGGHKDSIHDDVVYSAMLESFDEEMFASMSAEETELHNDPPINLTRRK